MKVFFYRTNWALLLYMLYVNDWEETFYCFAEESHVPDYFKKQGIKYFVYIKNSKSNNVIGKFYNRLKNEIRYLYFIHKLKSIDNKECFGDDDSMLSKAFLDNNFCVIEDGLINYAPDHIKYLQSIGTVFGLGCKYKAFGFDPIIKRIILSGAFSIPKQIQDKVICVNVKKLWENKSEGEKQKILSVFNTTAEELEKYKSKFVLLTQNYDVYDILSGETEYSRYVKILKNYPYGKVLIKPHPMSSFDYAKAFPDYKVVDKQKIPFELMALYNDYKVLISINSTAAFTLPGKKQIDLYDTEGVLKKRFYSSENQSINIDEIKDLIPIVKKPPLTLRWIVWRIHWFLLRKFVWHIN